MKFGPNLPLPDFSGPDNGESSSEVSDVSSLTDTSLSEEEEEPKSGKHMDEALAKLQAARDKKIQMSIEKKNKTEIKEKSVFVFHITVV